MLLTALNKLYDRLKNDPDYEISPPGFSLQGIAFSVVLNPDGSLVNIQDVRMPEGKKLKPRQMQVLGANKPSGSGLNPTFLWDTAGYLLGYTDPPPENETDKQRLEREKKETRVKECHLAFVKFHLDQEKELHDESFSAVCRFLEQWDPARTADYPFLKMLVGGYGTFQLVNEPGFLFERETIRDYFLKKTLTDSDPETLKAQSLISGEILPVARLQAAIKGIGEKAAPLVGFNDPAYESYGKEQAFNAPVGEQEAFRYGVALNALTNGPKKAKHCISIGDMKVIFWAESSHPLEDVFPFTFSEPSRDNGLDAGTVKKLNLLYSFLRSGVLPPAMPEFAKDVPFYVIGLSTNVTRVVVRFFCPSSTGKILDNFKKHFEALSLVKSFESDPDFPSIRDILNQTCPLKSGKFPDTEKIPDNLEGLFMRSIIEGTPYPASIFNRILQRFKIDHYQDYVKTSFLKAYLIRNCNRKEFSMALDRENKDPGYLCGRIFAVMFLAQRDAVGDVGVNIRDSFMSSASSRPAGIFSRLLRLYSHHLGQISEGKKRYYEILMQEIMWKLDGKFPDTLDYPQQGAFFLGYHHQIQDFFTKKNPTDTSSAEPAEKTQN